MQPERVRVVAEWSTFYGLHGTVVTRHATWALVLIDGDAYPLRFGLEVLVPIDC
jgi:hypothetical protein